jgi:hypothetical protein
MDPEDKVRTFVKLAGVAGAFLLAACSGKDSAVSADLQKDLERASTASEITLPQSQSTAQVVSAIERTTPPAPRKVAQSQRAPKHRAAPKATPRPVEVEEPQVATEVEPEPVEITQAPTSEPAAIPSQRPRPVAASGGGSGDGSMGEGRGSRGVSIGVGIGSVIGVVLRGGVVDGDECDPRTDGRRGGGVHTAVNNRFPIGVSTFPGSGRIGTAATVGGMILGGVRRR